MSNDRVYGFRVYGFRGEDYEVLLYIPHLDSSLVQEFHREYVAKQADAAYPVDFFTYLRRVGVMVNEVKPTAVFDNYTSEIV